MAAPTVTERVKPSGAPIEDGYQAFITFSGDPDLMIWEKTVKPPGIDIGDKIPISTMWNEEWETFAARKLKVLTEAGGTCGMATGSYTDLLAQIGVEQSFTIHISDGGSITFFGFLKTADLNDHDRNAMPDMNVSFEPTNRDPATGAEEGPVITPPSGT